MVRLYGGRYGSRFGEQQRRKHDVQNRFCPGNVKERLARGMQRMTRLMVGYDVVKVSRLLSRADLVR